MVNLAATNFIPIEEERKVKTALSWRFNFNPYTPFRLTKD
jgi:hypothetical protein